MRGRGNLVGDSSFSWHPMDSLTFLVGLGLLRAGRLLAALVAMLALTTGLASFVPPGVPLPLLVFGRTAPPPAGAHWFPVLKGFVMVTGRLWIPPSWCAPFSAGLAGCL